MSKVLGNNNPLISSNFLFIYVQNILEIIILYKCAQI
jgi:hypothetical protein